MSAEPRNSRQLATPPLATASEPGPEALERELRAAMTGEVRFDAGSRGAYSTDASNYREVPLGLVVPADVEDAVTAVEVCAHHGVALLSRGGGTSLAGQGTNAAVVIDWSKYVGTLRELDAEQHRATIEPGLVLDGLRDAAEAHQLTFGPDPSTHNRCTLGGMIGNNSCGIHSVMAGRTVDNIESMEVLTYDGLRMHVGPTSENELEAIIAAGGRKGEIYAGMKALRDRHADAIRAAYPDIPRRVSGYNLDELLPERGFNVARALVGTEGTCVTVLSATCRLVPSPPARTLLVLGYPSVFEAGDHVPEVLSYDPIGLEGIDEELVEFMAAKHLHPGDRRMLLPEGNGWLLAEFGAQTKAEADEKANACTRGLAADATTPSMKRFDDPTEEGHVWDIRKSGLGATARVPNNPDTWPGWEDSAVPPEKIGHYLRDLRELFARYGYQTSIYGHFGDGCIHCRIPFDLVTADGLANYRAFVDEAADLVLSYGGSLSGEHGDGQARGELLPKMFGDGLVDAMRQFKQLWDPDNRMNPGRSVDADPILDHLKFGTDYEPLPIATQTQFAFPDDDGDLSRAANRCVGVGQCRATEGGTMCPSYMATGEEEHSTRGRARLLFEMLSGDSPVDGWRSDAVYDALDLCLACKACRTECPVNVDMATYKAEFLSHYWSGRLRPRNAYALGLIHWAARVAVRMPDLANAVTHTPGLRTLVKRAGGVAEQREVPKFARQPFTDWFARRVPATREPDEGASAKILADEGRGRVMVWPDTFNNHWHPGVGRATVEVLEALGYEVVVPPRQLCCGRPLYDYGMLDLAKRQLRQILDALRDEIRAGTPLVGMEPSCLAVFRDELTNLFPRDQDAQRLARQSVMLTELLSERASEIQWPTLSGEAVVHGHCHQTSVMGMSADLDVLSRLGLDFELLDSGCCGMAGAFGFEADHYDVSVACAEHRLAPAARQAVAEEKMIITSGFSCGEQLRQLDDIHTTHTHEVLHRAFVGGGPGRRRTEGSSGVLRANRGALAGAAALAVVGGVRARG
jgi:FAD/FMN-containing dehydrogenase/Fe-S oxidoreductase